MKTSFVVLLLCISACFARSLPVQQAPAELTALQRDFLSDFLQGLQIGTQIVGQLGTTLLPIIGVLGKRDVSEVEIAMLRDWLSDLINVTKPIVSTIPTIISIAGLLGKRDVSADEAIILRDWFSDFLQGVQIGTQIVGQLGTTILPIIDAFGKRDLASEALLRGWMDEFPNDLGNVVNQVTDIFDIVTQIIPAINAITGKRDVSEADLALARDFWSDFAAGFQQGFFGVLNVAQQLLPAVLPIITAVGKRDAKFVLPPNWPTTLPTNWNNWNPLLIMSKRDVNEVDLAQLKGFWDDFSAGFQQGFFGALNVAQQLLPAVLPIITAVGK